MLKYALGITLIILLFYGVLLELSSTKMWSHYHSQELPNNE